MQIELANKLKEKKVLIPESKITATVRAKGATTDYVEVLKELIITTINKNTCIGYHAREPHILFTVPFTAIECVDGMELSRIARAFNLHEDGSERSVGKKRGRKPKEQQ